MLMRVHMASTGKHSILFSRSNTFDALKSADHTSDLRISHILDLDGHISSDSQIYLIGDYV